MRYALVLALALCSALADAQTLKWTFATEGQPLSPTLYPDATHPTGVIAVAGKNVALVNGNGEAVWRATLPTNAAGPAAVADIDGDGAPETVLALSSGSVVCLDAQGKTRWIWNPHRPVDSSGWVVLAALGSSGTDKPKYMVLQGTNDGFLSALDDQGELYWRFHGDPFRVGPPAVGPIGDNGPSNSIVYGTDNGHVYCLKGNGCLSWSYAEMAPYGRSAMTIADLMGDGKWSVLFTRSNNGVDQALTAIDGKSGKFQWRSKDVMQGYYSTVPVDLDGDGKYEVLHGDKANWLYCENPDGSERWRTQLGGRGIFWAPAVGDINGDGRPEIIVPVRGLDPATGACAFVVDADGKVLTPLKIGAEGNASPCIGDIDGDGQFEVLFATQKPDGIQAFTWNGTGKVLWPSLRGDSCMTGATRIQRALCYLSVVDYMMPPNSLRCKPDTPLKWGENELTFSWNTGAPENTQLVLFPPAFVTSYRPYQRVISIYPVPAGASSVSIKHNYVEETDLFVQLLHFPLGDGYVSDGFFYFDKVHPRYPEDCDYPRVSDACNAAITAGTKLGADVAGLRARLTALDSAVKDLAAAKENLDADTKAERATALRKQARATEDFAKACTALWKAGYSDSFAYWPDENPWDTFDPLAVPGEFTEETPVTISAYQDEFEDAAINLLNLTPKSFDVRCAYAPPKLAGGSPDPDPALAKHITLRHGVMVPAHKGGMVLDALPELGPDRLITLSPGEATQLWLVLDTHGLDAGKHEFTLYIGSLEEKTTVRKVPVTLEVWPVRLPENVCRRINWTGIQPNEVPDATLKDMLDHGLNVGYGPALPAIPVDADGNAAASPDWAAFDATLKRMPDTFLYLFFSAPAVQWANNAAPPADDPRTEHGYATALHAMATHLQEQGVDYDRWAFYPMDEPWLTGLSNIPGFRQTCTRIKAADPKARIYADPTGLLRVEYLDEFKDLVDIWQPEINYLKRSPELLEWFQKNAKTLWAYEATDPSKNLLPLGYYRALGWFAWRFKLEGYGFWCYKANDAWWPLETTDYSVVYQNEGSVTPSRRWEATRDGTEDFRTLCALRDAAKRIRAQGRNDEADRAEALMDEAQEQLIGWQAKNIDEITRQLRDYEMDYAKLKDYRQRIAETLIQLRDQK
jgi:hypothetical protein